MSQAVLEMITEVKKQNKTKHTHHQPPVSWPFQDAEWTSERSTFQFRLDAHAAFKEVMHYLQKARESKRALKLQ